MTVEIKRGFWSNRDRYHYDFRECTYELGWAQVDTKQDASYYGTWTNPTTLEIFNYAEGDTYLTKCTTEDEYRQEMLKLVQWNRERGYWLGIDLGLRPEMKQRFADLGFADCLY